MYGTISTSTPAVAMYSAVVTTRLPTMPTGRSRLGSLHCGIHRTAARFIRAPIQVNRRDKIEFDIIHLHCIGNRMRRL